MYQLIYGRELAKRSHASLERAFRRNSTKTALTLSTPGGQIPRARVYFRRDLNVWAYFEDRSSFHGNKILCWFGAGEPSWQPSIEINFPVRRTLHCYGQLVGDANRNVCLAHKGGLGGGKFTVATGPFGDLINGFERERVLIDNVEHEYFVFGQFSKPVPLLRNIAAFVHEAQRIRELRWNDRKFKAALEAVGGAVRKGRAIGGNEYKDEAIGRGAYRINREVKFERIHAHVQRALAKELQRRKLKYGNLRQKYGLGPDLYIKDAQGKMTHLFEIKVGIGSQSTFTALGQLLVYSAGQDPTPDATLVTRSLPSSPQFAVALKRQRIKVLRYTVNENLKVNFLNLDATIGAT